MSIIFETDRSWLICQETFINKIYNEFINFESKTMSVKVKHVFFNIKTPMIMNSQAAKWAAKSDGKDLAKKIREIKQKRKKSLLKSNNSKDQVSGIIENIVDELLQKVKCLGYFKVTDVLPEEWLENNSSARQAARDILDNNVPVEESCCRIYENVSNVPVLKTFGNEDYLIPPNCTYVTSDVNNISNLLGNIYDCIVIDPPWRNKSVRRKRRYLTCNCENLLQVPINELTKPGTLVVIWATNNNTQLRFIKERLFPQWNVKHCTDWHWAKITTKGAFIYPLDSPHKKPYENIIIGSVSIANAELCSAQHKVIVSVPSSIHSHKPPLSDVLKPYLPNEPKCLEIFARYLLPGWTSIGNEVLKLQNLKMWEINEVT